MTKPTLEADLIINGDKSLRIFEEKGVIYPAKPVPRFIEFSVRNISKNTVKEVHLPDYLSMDLIATAFTADVVEDDTEGTDPDGNMSEPKIVKAVVDVVEREVLVHRVKFEFSSFPSYDNRLIINHLRTWKIRTNKDVNQLTFYCEPIFIDRTIEVP